MPHRRCALIVELCGLLTGFVFPCATVAQTSAPFGNPPRWRVTEDRRITGEKEDLVDVSDIVRCCGNRLGVVQQDENVIRLFSMDGKPSGAIGRKGAGPGEFQTLDSFGVVADSLWAYDIGLKRTTVFAPTGSPARTFTLLSVAPPPTEKEGVATLRILRPLALYPDGTTLVLASPMVPAELRRSGPDIGSWILRVDPWDSIVPLRKIVAKLPSNGGTYQEFLTPTSTIGGSVPFYARPTWTVSRDGRRIAIVTTLDNGTEPAVSLTVLSADGDLVFRKQFPFLAEQIPARVKDSAVTALITRATDPRIKALYDQTIRSRVPSFYAPVLRALYGRDGTLWIQLRSPPSPSAPKRLWIALDSRGVPIGRVELGAREILLDSEQESLWVADHGPDIPDVVRLKLVRGQ